MLWDCNDRLSCMLFTRAQLNLEYRIVLKNGSITVTTAFHVDLVDCDWRGAIKPVRTLAFPRSTISPGHYFQKYVSDRTEPVRSGKRGKVSELLSH
jgi:hypothetical protein